MAFWEGASLWVLGNRPGASYPATAFHSHHAVQLTFALRGKARLATHDHQLSADAMAIAPDTEHTFFGDELIAHLFIEPEGVAGRALQRDLFSSAPLVSIPASRVGDLPSCLLAWFDKPRRDDRTLLELGRALVSALVPESERDERPEVRIRRMSSWAAARLTTPLTLADAAAHVGLSSGRARHLFVEQTGLPFKKYVLWLRLNRAVELFSSGSSLTEAAHGAGFSDSSHLSRTFKRMFGIAADSLRVL
ncbi:MAG TPA: AraC family transcriptional regulator [Kofleriaceae bacterium]|jgi:AraC-like DNA-binding protein